MLALAAAALAALAFAGCQDAPANTTADASTSDASTPAAAQEAPVEVEYLYPEGGEGRPYSEAVRVGDILYLSGKIGLAGAEEGVQGETRVVLEGIRDAVERYGSSMDRVFKCMVILADIEDFSAMNEVYTSFFAEGRRPARSTFAASGLAGNAQVEIECMAAL